MPTSSSSRVKTPSLPAFKICIGPLHPPGGLKLPIAAFPLKLTGPHAGRLSSGVCRKCRNIRRSTSVPPEVFLPLLWKILENTTARVAANVIGIDEKLISEIKCGKRKRINRKTFQKIERASLMFQDSPQPVFHETKLPAKPPQRRLSFEERQVLRHLVADIQRDKELRSRRVDSRRERGENMKFRPGRVGDVT